MHNTIQRQPDLEKAAYAALEPQRLREHYLIERLFVVGASKGGIAQVTKALANEWASRGVNVNAIAPGYIATDNTQGLREDPMRSRDLLARIPAGRWSQAEDIAATAVFLCSSAAEYIHGPLIPFDGGWLAR